MFQYLQKVEFINIEIECDKMWIVPEESGNYLEKKIFKYYCSLLFKMAKQISKGKVLLSPTLIVKAEKWGPNEF